MNNILLFLLILAILGGAIWYIVAENRKGNKCIGCSCACSHDCKDKGTCGIETQDKDC